MAMKQELEEMYTSISEALRRFSDAEKATVSTTAKQRDAYHKRDIARRQLASVRDRLLQLIRREFPEEEV